MRNTALPIGFEQTISQALRVGARMIEALRGECSRKRARNRNRMPLSSALLARLAKEVYSGRAHCGIARKGARQACAFAVCRT